MSLKESLLMGGCQILTVDPKARSDPSARYIMPMLQLKYEGAGNGSKTVIENMHMVCRDILQRPEEEGLMKFFSNEFGTQSMYVKKDDKFILSGFFTQEQMQLTLDAFIVRFVLCSHCRNPETDLYIDDENGAVKNKKKFKLAMMCRGCGKSTLLNPSEKIYARLLLETCGIMEAKQQEAERATREEAKKLKREQKKMLQLLQEEKDNQVTIAGPPPSSTDLTPAAVAQKSAPPSSSSSSPPPEDSTSAAKTPPSTPPPQPADLDAMFASMDKKKKREKKSKKEKEGGKDEKE